MTRHQRQIHKVFWIGAIALAVLSAFFAMKLRPALIDNDESQAYEQLRENQE